MIQYDLEVKPTAGMFKKSRQLQMYGSYILNQKFDSIRISVLCDMTKIWKKIHAY